MENIQYLPEALQGRLQLQYGRRQLANRDGVLIIFDQTGEYLKHSSDMILKLHTNAQLYSAEHPDHKLVLWENSCGLTGEPFQNGQIPEQIRRMVQKGGEL